MPDNNIPASNPEPEALPAEFDFTQTTAENPRVRRRSLKAKPATTLKPADGAPAAARELAKEAPPTTRAAKPASSSDDETEVTEPAQPKPHFASTVQPSHPAKSVGNSAQQTASPHGTRPATLYYSSAPRKEKETTPASPSPTPMKSTTPASTASTTSAPSTAATRPVSSVRPASVVDYRTNVERQAREQKSVGGILSILVYSLIGLFVIGASLSAYGAYIVSQQLQQQSATVHQLDDKYAGEVASLKGNLATTLDTLTQSQAQIAHQQELILKQQDTINKLLAANQATADALKAERKTRADETASLRARVKTLEYRGPSTQRY